MAADPTEHASTEPPATMARGVRERLRTLLRALDRQDRLESATTFVGWLEDERAAGQLADAAREMLLRALRVAADPINYRLLCRLEAVDGTALPALMTDAGLTRVAVSERVNDLVQTGLASRELIGDEIRLTPLAAGLIELVEDVAKLAGDGLEDDLRPSRGSS